MNHEETIFEQALGIGSQQAREEFLRGECAGNEAMFQRLRGLLRAHDRAGKFLEHERPADGESAAVPAAADAVTRMIPVPVTEKPGDRIGRYKLLQKIGEGGCGVVYMAEQEEPVRRRVALKIIKLGMDTRQVIARFEAERQALALMDHPNIAKVFDAGVTERPFAQSLFSGAGSVAASAAPVGALADRNVCSATASNTAREARALPLNEQISRNGGEGLSAGRPYFVMELVRGVKITEYCDEKNLTTQQRLELFTQVCRAVQHAHQKGIIHRDLKPSNILVSFNDGVAVPKVIDFGIAKATTGEPLTKKTVFTAFEQFIGTPAYMSPEQALVTNLDIDTRSDIYSLGVLLYELLTGQTPFDPKELLKSGIEAMRRTICESEPARPSTRLSTLPGEALSTTAQRRGLDAPKLVSQLRGDLDWIVMKCLEKDRARRYESANGLATDIQRHLSNEPVVACPPSNLYRFQKLVRRNKLAFAAGAGIAASLVLGLAIALWQSIEKTRAYNRALTEAAKSQQVAQFLSEMFDGINPRIALGRDTTLLKEILGKAVQRIGTELTNQPEVEIELRATLAESYNALGLYHEAAELARQCLDLARARFPAESAPVAEALFQVGMALNFLGQLKEAEAIQRESVAIRRKLLAAQPAGGFPSTNAPASHDPVFHVSERFRPDSLYESLSELGHVFYNQGEFAQAETTYREALALARRFRGNKHRSVATQLSGLGIVLGELGKLDEAEATLRESLEAFRDLSAGQANPGVADLLNNLAQVLGHEGKFDEAEHMYLESLEMTKKMVGPEHIGVANGLHNLACLAHDRERLAEAETREREAIAMHRRLGTDELALAGSLNRLGDILAGAGKIDEAQQSISEALALRRRSLGNENVYVATSLVSLGSILQGQGKSAEAESMFRESLAMRRKLLGNAHPNVADSLQSLGGLLRDEGKLVEAEPLLREALEIVRRPPRKDTPRTAKALNELALLLWKKGNLEEAESMFRESLAIREKTFGQKHSDTLNSLALVLRDQRKLDEAEPMFREALDLKRKLSGNESLVVMVALNNLGLLLTDKAKLDEAESLFREALALSRKFSGEESIDVAWTLINLSSALRREGKLLEAEETCRQSLTIRKKLLSPTHPDVASSLSALAAVLRDAGKPAEAEPFLRQALELRRQIFGNEHPTVETSLNNLAGLLEAQGKLPEAETSYVEALAIRRQRLGNNHPDVADSLVGLGRLLCRLSRPAEAEPLFGEALAIRENRIPDDWRTFNTRSLLGDSLLNQKKYADSESLLLRGYEGMKQRAEKIPAEAKIRLKEALQRLVQLYEETGRSDRAAEWKQKLAEFEKAEAERKAPK